tara:strand:- start:4209 stop:5558 length:1350 start_codon:yes stop_codon:yes gene_type:complete
MPQDNLLNCSVTTWQAFEEEGDSPSSSTMVTQVLSDSLVEDIDNASGFSQQLATQMQSQGYVQQGDYVLLIEPDPGYVISVDDINIGGVEQETFFYNAEEGPGQKGKWFTPNQALTFAFAPNLMWVPEGIPGEIQFIRLFNTDYVSPEAGGTGQDGYSLDNKVMAIVRLLPSFQMPNSDVTLNIDFDGQAVEYQNQPVKMITGTERNKVVVNPSEPLSIFSTAPTKSMWHYAYGGDTKNPGLFPYFEITDELGNTLTDGGSFSYLKENYKLKQSSLTESNFNFNDGDSIGSGDVPEYIYMKLWAVLFNDKRSKSEDYEEVYLDVENWILREYIGKTTVIGDMFVRNYPSNMVTINESGDQIEMIDLDTSYYTATEIFPKSGGGSRANAILFKIKINPAWSFSNNIKNSIYVKDKIQIVPGPTNGLSYGDIISNEPIENNIRNWKIQIIN